MNQIKAIAFFTFLSLMCSAPFAMLAVAQEQQAEAEQPQVREELQANPVMQSEEFREELATQIKKAASESDDLSRFEKRRIDRIMEGGGWFRDWRRERVITKVAQKLDDAGKIAYMPKGVQAATNWGDIITFIERLMPLILQLISLFGG